MSPPLSTSDLDALVLAGGASRRMRLPKACLPLGNTTVLGRVLAVVHPLFRRVLVVARDTAGWPRLDAEVLTDDRPQRGPLVGLVRGLRSSDALWCFVVGCDMPFLNPEVIRRMAERLEGCDILAPRLKGRLQPLHAFYARGCLPHAERLLDSGITSLRALFQYCEVRTVADADLLDLDPQLLSFRDLDTVEEYQEAQRLVRGFSRQEIAQ